MSELLLRRWQVLVASVVTPAVVVTCVVASCLLLPPSSAGAAPGAVQAPSIVAKPGITLPFPTVPAYTLPGHPAANHPFSPSAACTAAPRGAACENAAIFVLDTDRHAMGLPPYKLPANFLSLGQINQVLILVNLDRKAYGEPPAYGVSAVSSGWAATPWLSLAKDPEPPGWDKTWFTSGNQVYDFTSNFAANYPNMLYAYVAWMYDDGYGSGNGDCTVPHAIGCWGHRNGILSVFFVYVALNGVTTPYYLADIELGNAVGPTHGGATGYSQLFTGSESLAGANFEYLWSTAVAAGAGSHVFAVPSTVTLTASTSAPVVGRTVTYTAKVSPMPTIGGDLQFGGQLAQCGLRPVSGGVAKCARTYVAAGAKTIRARFVGNAMVAGSSTSQSVHVAPKTK